MGGKKESRHLRRRLLTLRSWHFETSQTSSVVMNLATVDAPGMFIHIPQ